MKKLNAGLAALTLTCACAMPALAADFYRGGLKDGPPPPPPVFAPAPIWTGFYVGVNGGYGETANDGPLSPSGGFGGGQIGYNWQGLFGLTPWVIGVEADIQGAGISDNTGYGAAYVENSLNYFGTVRGRLGYAIGPTLIYATGGFAYGEVESKGSVAGLSYDVAETQTGYTVGGGVEYKFNPSWSIKGEYLYVDLDANNWNGAGPLNGSPYSDRSQLNTFRLGVNFATGQGFGPLN